MPSDLTPTLARLARPVFGIVCGGCDGGTTLSAEVAVSARVGNESGAPVLNAEDLFCLGAYENQTAARPTNLRGDGTHDGRCTQTRRQSDALSPPFPLFLFFRLVGDRLCSIIFLGNRRRGTSVCPCPKSRSPSGPRDNGWGCKRGDLLSLVSMGWPLLIKTETGTHRFHGFSNLAHSAD